LELDFLNFWAHFRVKKIKNDFNLLSRVLYVPYLLLDAPVDAHFASFPAGVSEAGNAISDVEDDDDDGAIAVAAEPVGAERATGRQDS
jgi:hypothetical protein